MDSSRFDTLTKVLARSSSRRHMLQGLAATAVGGVLASLGIKQVDASPLRDPKGVSDAVTDHCANINCPLGTTCKDGRCRAM